jgi:hypothetical protein
VKTLIRSFESGSKHWRKSIILNAAGVFDVVKSKNISSKPCSSSLKIEKRMPT